MSAAAHAGSLAGHLSDHAATRPHCFIETSGESIHYEVYYD